MSVELPEHHICKFQVIYKWKSCQINYYTKTQKITFYWNRLLYLTLTDLFNKLHADTAVTLLKFIFLQTHI